MGFSGRYGGTAIPTRRQRCPTTCGWTAMAIVADHYGTDTGPMGREQDWPETSMWDIKMMAETLGLSPTVGTVEGGGLSACPLPAIVLIDHGRDRQRTGRKRRLMHFVVVFDVTADHVLLSDPGEGRAIEIPRWWFEEVWLGVAAVFGRSYGEAT